MRVMGVDPGLQVTGYAVVEQAAGRLSAVAHGSVRAGNGVPPEQLLALRDALRDVMRAHRPDAVALERLFVNSNRLTAMRAGQASGVALLAAAEEGLDVFEYTPSEVKRAVVGVGTATKQQVAYMVRAILGAEVAPDSPDAADALALAICHANGAKLRAATGRARGRAAG